MSLYDVEFPVSAVAAAESIEQHNTAGRTLLVIGGGTLTMPALSQGIARPDLVIDLGRIGAREIKTTDAEIIVEAMVSYQQLIHSPIVRRELRLLHTMASGITGGIQIRHQGTLGGAACAARPQSDAPAVLVALHATMTAQSPVRTRRIAASDFFEDAEHNGLTANEVLTSLSLPRRLSAMRSGYYKFKFVESSWPVVTASVMLPAREDDQSPGELVLGGLAVVPVVVSLPRMRGDEFNEEAVALAATAAVADIPPEQRWADLRADSVYRGRIAPEIARRAFRLAMTDEGSAA